MGLELSIERLKGLFKYVFGLGFAQVALTTAAFSFLGYKAGANPVEAFVMGNALSLSSSAFVLQLLRERGELSGSFGEVAFSILLFQDIAVVPLLVILPVLAKDAGDSSALATALGIASLKGLGALGGIILAGQALLSRIFQAVAVAQSPEAFVAMILLTVVGTGWITDEVGLSDTLGAFLGGVLLAETKFRFQIEADIQAIRGLLLGLFFISVGLSVDLNLAIAEAPIVLAVMGALLSIKAVTTTLVARAFQLDWATAIRSGLLLSQGGEFAFVIFALAKQLGILPADLNNLLIVVVAMSMALTPALAAAGEAASRYLQAQSIRQDMKNAAEAKPPSDAPFSDCILVCGFGPIGKTVTFLLNDMKQNYVAFEVDPTRVEREQSKGFSVFFADCTRPEVFKAAGVDRPKAAVVTVRAHSTSLRMVQALKAAFPEMPIFVQARGGRQQEALRSAGATVLCPTVLEASLQLGEAALRASGLGEDDVTRFLEGTRRYEHEELSDTPSTACSAVDGNDQEELPLPGSAVSSVASLFTV
eukprot:CAMPEP_0196666696 /NCGR_PEP_ID=MMETSP1086-20130531/64662_1 /TAXON_ID=77921 /ORGANISM="Cyanoptyche  gloeocystis , Strain SAG4.97" /LENGTH=533 /DNA_ID=CAMNT_0042003927 /DNA_START=636 /DNA_END=2234 /DNA_ORIENTATION=-